MRSGWFQRTLLPGFVFQSVVIAGGYGTGREIAEFFLTLGPRAGLLAMLVATAVFSLVCAASFEFARTFRATDYDAFFRKLIGPLAPAYELAYYGLMLIVLAVVAAAAGSILQETFGQPYLVGVLGMMGLIGLLVFAGTGLIERFLSGWSVVLYAVYGALFVWALARFHPEIGAALSGTTAPAQETGSWFVGGVAYAGYNLALIPALLFSIRHVRTRTEAVTAGIWAGPIAMIPAALFYLSVVGLYPGVVDDAVPANTVLEALGSRGFQILFQVMLFGTLVETGTGLIHSVNERIGHALERKGREGGLTPGGRTLVAALWLVLAAVIAQFGLIGLIAKGYGTLTWVFIAIYVVPILTWGVWLIIRTPTDPIPEEETPW